jgi:hypothetical protein
MSYKNNEKSAGWLNGNTYSGTDPMGCLLLASHQGIQALQEYKVADVERKTEALAIYDQNQSDDDSVILSYFRPEEK